MDNALGQFYAEIKRKDGKDYEPDSLRVMQAAIQCYLVKKQRYINILSDPEFSSSRSVLEGKAKILRQNGYARRPNASQALTNEEEELLWTEGKLGKDSPTSLV